MKHAAWATPGLLLFVGAAPCADAEEIRCPEEVKVQQSLEALPAGWQAAADSVPHRLASVALYDGPVAEGASLVPDEESERGTELTVLWSVGAPNERGYWLACGYSSTSLRLAKKLPTASTCRAVYDRSVTVAGLPSVVSFECR
jgi:hypothetical protein